jgi:hypothetical protein
MNKKVYEIINVVTQRFQPYILIETNEKPGGLMSF